MAALYFYWPGLRAPFLGDDYLLLLASRDESLGAFVKSSSLPWADPGLLQLGDHYWRPLSFLTFRAMYAVFGAEPLPYHLLGLAFHLASVVLVYALALRLMKSRTGAAAAAIVMALDPAGFESVTWAAAINSAGLPFALAAWLAFLRATRESGEISRGWFAGSLALQAIALAFRETAVVVVAAMLLCYLLAEPRPSPRRRATLFAVAFPLALAAADAVVLAGVFSPGRARHLVSLDRDAATHAWFYLKQVVPALPASSTSPLAQTQRLAGAAMLALPLAAVITRRWLVFALSLAFLASIIPYAVFTLGNGPRYFYFPQAIFSLLCGAVVAEFVSRLPARASAPARALAPVAAVLALCMGAVVGRDRVNQWVTQNPDVHEHWIARLHEAYPVLPDGAGVFAVGTPMPISLFGAYILAPTIAFEYPGSDHRVYVIDHEHIAFAEAIKQPGDVIFEYSP